jgi:hypothetical protein
MSDSVDNIFYNFFTNNGTNTTHLDKFNQSKYYNKYIKYKRKYLKLTI